MLWIFILWGRMRRADTGWIIDEDGKSRGGLFQRLINLWYISCWWQWFFFYGPSPLAKAPSGSKMFFHCLPFTFGKAVKATIRWWDTKEQVYSPIVRATRRERKSELETLLQVCDAQQGLRTDQVPRPELTGLNWNRESCGSYTVLPSLYLDCVYSSRVLRASNMN